MANIVSSNNLTSLYGSGQTTILTSTPVPNVAGTIPSRNLTTLYSGSGNPVQAVLPYGNSNVVSLLNAGTDGANTITNIVATGTVTSNNVNTPTVYSQGMAVQGYDFVQMQYSNGANLPLSPYDIGTGSWFYLDPGGATWQSNTTGTLHTVILGNDGNVTANYFIGNVVGNITGVANFANYSGNVTVSNQPNITQVGNLLNLTSNGNVNFANADNVNLGSNSNVHISGGNSGYVLSTDGNSSLSWVAINTVGIANFANFAGNVTVSNQPNITSVGTLANLSVSGNITSGNANLGNLVIANFFSGNGSLLTDLPATYSNANVSTFLPTYGGILLANTINFTNNSGIIEQGADRITITGNANTVSTGAYFNDTGEASIFSNSYVAIVTNTTNIDNPTWIFDASGNLTTPGSIITGGDISGANVISANYFVGDGSLLTNINGSNVSNVANANYANYSNIANIANSVNVANVVGIGNIATTNYDGNAGNVLYGNGGFFALPSISNVANANYANFAGVAYSVSGSNVTGTVANANYSAYAGQANTANLATYATTANSVAVANVVGIGNIATINLDGNSSNILYGNGIFSSVPNTANANYASYAGNVTIGTQSNITATGNLYTFTVGNDANILSPRLTYTSNSPAVGNVTGSNSSFQYSDYGISANSAACNNLTFARYRGNITNPATLANNDSVMRLIPFVYNGNVLTRIGSVGFSAPLAGNTLFQTANVTMQPGSFSLTTGNPNGNIYNTTAASATNVFGYNQQGTLTLTPGTYNGGASGLVFNNYGANSDGSGPRGSQIALARYRGSRDGNSVIVSGDGIGSISFQGYTGPSGIALESASIVGVTTGTITSGSAPNANINFTTTNGYFNFYNPISVSGNINAGNITAGNANIGNLQLNQFQENVYSYGNASGTITPDFNNGSIQKLTLTGNITMNTLGNAIAGRSMTLILTQDATGNRTLTSSMLFAGNYKTLTTLANSKDIISLFFDGSTYYASLTTGYA